MNQRGRPLSGSGQQGAELIEQQRLGYSSLPIFLVGIYWATNKKPALPLEAQAFVLVVEAGGFEPPSVSSRPSDLHV